MIVLLALLFVSAEPRNWEGGASLSYAKTGDFHGFGAGARGLYAFDELFAAGLSVDFARFRTSGDAAQNGDPYSFEILSTYLGGVAQLRYPLGRFVPYLEAGLGATIASSKSTNSVCDVGSGLGFMGGAGVKFSLIDVVALGVRASARNTFGSSGCILPGGPFYPDLDYGLFSAGATAELRL